MQGGLQDDRSMVFCAQIGSCPIAYVPHPVAWVRGILIAPWWRCSSRSGLGGKHGEFESESFEPFELNGIQRPVEPPLRANPDNGGVLELAGAHQSRETGRRFVVPTG
jgi:hypothetical protein